MASNDFAEAQEARRLNGLPRAQARAQLGDRIARTFQLDGAGFAEGLAFNAHLCTALRTQAQAVNQPTIWDAA